MSQLWKWFVVLAVTLPLAGYVAGSLVGGAETPQDRAPIVVEQSADETDPDPSEEPSERRSDKARPDGDDDDDKSTDDDDNAEQQNKSRSPKVVRPAPDRFDTRTGSDDDDDDDDDDRDDDGEDDDDDDDD